MTVVQKPQVGSPMLHFTILFTILVFVTLLAMSIIFRVEVVAQGTGKIVPIGRVQTIQPEFSGRIADIHVTNGQTVAQGDVLVTLDQVDAQAALDSLSAEFNTLTREDKRLRAYATTLAQKSPEDAGFAQAAIDTLTTALPDDTSQTALLETAVEQLQAELARISADGDALLRGQAVTQANIAQVEAAMAIQAERLENSRQLLANGTISRSALLDAQQAFTQLETSKEVYLRELDQKAVQQEALDASRRSLLANTQAQLSNRSDEIAQRLVILTQDRRTAQRRVDATVITAPVTGTIDQLKIFTVGGVVDAGAELMRLVPAGGRYEIEAIFANQDVGFIVPGQPVNIRLDAFPAERFGFLRGVVSDVAADSTESPDGSFGYLVRITPNTEKLVVADRRYDLRPGMTGRADITTDERRIISYFFAPIVQVVEASLGER